MRFEIRRLHDQYRYTTVYVTHDQAEAMTTADQIAVMNVGRVEQLGSPRDIYDAPNSEFVARFLGASNIIRGMSVGDGRVSVAGVALHCTGAARTASGACAIAIRQHDLRILTVQPPDLENVLPATVVRNVFLGASRDYMVELVDGTQLRVVTAPGENVPQGAKVWLHMPFERCRALQR